MWIFFNDAALSIVADRDEGSALLVRARARGDIERVFPGAAVRRTWSADYLYRAMVSRTAVGAAIAARAAEIDYDNFKGSVTEGDRHDAYLGCWATMRDFQNSRADAEETVR